MMYLLRETSNKCNKYHKCHAATVQAHQLPHATQSATENSIKSMAVALVALVADKTIPSVRHTPSATESATQLPRNTPDDLTRRQPIT